MRKHKPKNQKQLKLIKEVIQELTSFQQMHVLGGDGTPTNTGNYSKKCKTKETD